MARTLKPDAILMDLDLPLMDGFEATRAIKEDVATAGIPVIALTGHVSPSDVAKAATAGFDGYETKPIAYTRLMEKVNRFIEDGV